MNQARSTKTSIKLGDEKAATHETSNLRMTSSNITIVKLGDGSCSAILELGDEEEIMQPSSLKMTKHNTNITFGD